MISYPAIFEPDRKAGGYVVRFPDFKWGVTQAENFADAMSMAEDALQAIVSDHMDRRLSLPKPGRSKGKGIHLVSLPLLQSAKVGLYFAMRKEGVRKADLARRMGIQKSQVDRLLDLNRASRMDQVEAAFEALNKKLTIVI